MLLAGSGDYDAGQWRNVLAPKHIQLDSSQDTITLQMLLSTLTCSCYAIEDHNFLTYDYQLNDVCLIAKQVCL